MDLQPATESLRKLCGDDIQLSLSRCPAWGCDDICVLVYGELHDLAAAAFLKLVPEARIERIEASSPRRGPYTYSSVSFAA